MWQWSQKSSWFGTVARHNVYYVLPHACFLSRISTRATGGIFHEARCIMIADWPDGGWQNLIISKFKKEFDVNRVSCGRSLLYMHGPKLERFRFKFVYFTSFMELIFNLIWFFLCSIGYEHPVLNPKKVQVQQTWTFFAFMFMSFVRKRKAWTWMW